MKLNQFKPIHWTRPVKPDTNQSLIDVYCLVLFFEVTGRGQSYTVLLKYPKIFQLKPAKSLQQSWQAGYQLFTLSQHKHTPREGVPGHASVLPQDGPAQVKQDVVEALLLCAFGGQLQDLGVPVKQLTSVAGRGSRLHLITGQHPHFHTCLVERLNGVRCFFLESVVIQR